MSNKITCAKCNQEKSELEFYIGRHDCKSCLRNYLKPGLYLPIMRTGYGSLGDVPRRRMLEYYAALKKARLDQETKNRSPRATGATT